MKYKNLIFNTSIVVVAIIVLVVTFSFTAEAAYVGLGDATSSTRIVIEDTGDIGIGTTNPGSKLDVTGNMNLTGSLTSGVAGASNANFNTTMSMHFNMDSDNNETSRAFRWYTNGADAGGTELMTILESGNVGIGTTSPDNKLHVNGTTHTYAKVSVNSTGLDAASVYTDGTNGVYAGLMNGSGCGAGEWAVYNSGCRLKVSSVGRVRMPAVYNVAGTGADLRIESDGNLYRVESARRYKKDINYDDVDGDLVYQLKPVSYKLKALENAPEEIGFIAEDVEEVDPRLVVYSKEGTVDSLHYDRFSVLLVKAVQDLNTKVDTLEARVSELEEMLKNKN